LHQAKEHLQRWTTELEEAVNKKTAELVQSQERLRALASELSLAEQRERKRLAAELHDHLQQMLVCGKMTIGEVKRVVVGDPDCGGLLERVDDMLSEALTYSRTLVAELSPPVLHDDGLGHGLTWLGQYMKRHGQTVTVLVPENHEFKLPEAHRILIFQSVRELLINASKHAGTGKASVRLERRDENLHVTVSDEGKGFDLTVGTLATAGIPSGGISSKFGLFSIQERMRALDGSFVIQSAPGRGTTATLILPLVHNVVDNSVSPEFSGAAVVQETKRVKERDSPTKGRSMVQVLLVDDHAMVRQGLRSVLDAYDDLHVVAEARDGAEAVQLVGEFRPRVVVMDINMPRMNGIDATTHIKNHWPETTVIGISVNIGDNNSDAMKRAGAATVLPKDTAVDQLHDAIVQEVGVFTDKFAPPH
jgi:CheY-like chemotaxis protein